MRAQLFTVTETISFDNKIRKWDANILERSLVNGTVGVFFIASPLDAKPT